MNIQNLPLERIIYLDVETVPSVAHYDKLNKGMQIAWDKKCRFIDKENAEKSPSDKFKEYAGIYSEFGKIVCISMGIATKKDDEWFIRLKSYYGDNESTILEDVAEVLQKSLSSKKFDYICGHNIKEFDIPYICRRMMVNGLSLPDCLQMAGKKPWELDHLLDSLSLWKFGDYKHYTSLDLLMNLFEIPSPKDDIDGSDVGKVYWDENDCSRIMKYCEKDVLAVINLFFRWNGLDLVDKKNITFTVD